MRTLRASSNASVLPCASESRPTITATSYPSGNSRRTRNVVRSSRTRAIHGYARNGSRTHKMQELHSLVSFGTRSLSESLRLFVLVNRFGPTRRDDKGTGETGRRFVNADRALRA